MNFANILLKSEGKVSIITINRPQSLNALNGSTIKELELSFRFSYNNDADWKLSSLPEVGKIICSRSGH